MDKLKNILSPGHKDDDAKMYDTASSGQTSSAAQKLTSDVAGQAKTTPGSSHPHPADDPSVVAQHMPGAFASTPRDELSSTAGGLGASSSLNAPPSSTSAHATNPQSTTGYSTTQPLHASTAAPASAAAAATAHPAHSSSVGTGYSTAQPPHATTAAPASSAAAASTVPVHASGASDNGSVASIKSGVMGGPHATAAADPTSRGSTAVHTTRETVGTMDGTSTVKTTTTTALAPDGTPLHSQTHRERESSAVAPTSLGSSAGHSQDTSRATGTATIPTSSAGGHSSSGSGHDPSFSNRTLGHNQYGSLDPSGISTGTNLNTLGRDATAGLSSSAIQDSQHHLVHGPHQDTHPNQPGAAVGVTNQPAIGGSLPDRSRTVDEPGTRAAVGETATYSSFPVGGHHIDGPHQTATANALDPNVGSGAKGPSAGVVSSTGNASTRSPSHGHSGTAATIGTGATATGAGAYSAHELSQKAHSGPGQALTTEGMTRREAPVTGPTTHQSPSEAAAEKSITGDQTAHHASRQQASHPAAATSASTDKKHERDTTSGTHQTASHTAGAGGVPYAGTNEGRNQPLGAEVDKGPASSTIGPHKSNIMNILDPRVKPDAAVQGTEKSSKLDSRVEGATGATGTSTASEKVDHGASTGAHRSTQQMSQEPAKQSDVSEHAGSSHGQDSGRHGLSGLLHRDQPNKLHKDPPST